ncbi:MAG: enoyl-CoA hydratase/isomerase family protein [Brachymonas sp.]
MTVLIDTFLNTADIHAEQRGRIGFLSLNRPQALNALSLEMVRKLYAILDIWRESQDIAAIALRGNSRSGPFGTFCAGGDLRFFYEQTLQENPQVGNFFTEEYALDALIHAYPKPVIACMDGIVMGGGMGLAQGASHRIVTERSQLAMPETRIGFLPDVGGGYFLSRCPGYAGEWLGLTGNTVSGADALTIGWADHFLPSTRLPEFWQQLAEKEWNDSAEVAQWVAHSLDPAPAVSDDFVHGLRQADRYFAGADPVTIVHALEQAEGDIWAQATAATLCQRSPLMLHVVLRQIRSGRALSYAQNIYRERDMVHHCFHPDHLERTPRHSEVIEGIRALVIDKDQRPLWQPARMEDVTPEMVDGFFAEVWRSGEHPLRQLLQS